MQTLQDLYQWGGIHLMPYSFGRLQSFDSAALFTRKSVKIRPSLSTNQKNLLRDAQSWVEEYCLDSEMVNPVQFVFANIHGEIQAKMQKKYGGSPFITFNSVDLASQLKDAQVVKETDRVFDEFFTRFDNDSSHPLCAETVDDDNLGFNGLQVRYLFSSCYYVVVSLP